MKSVLQALTLSSGIFALTIVSSGVLYSQSRGQDKAIYTEENSPFYEKMQKEISEFNNKENPPKKAFKVDFSGMDLPKSVTEFTRQWHNPPTNQGLTGTCWCFSTTSFFESEIYRLTKREIKLSEIYTVYWEYVEKAKRFVHQRGNSEFAEGSESNAVRRIWSQYGVVPEDSYTGKLPGQKHHDHRQVYAEMNEYLQKVKANNAWDEETVIQTIKSIMDHYFGKPPAYVSVDGQKMTPQEYFHNVVKLNMDDYVDFISLMQSPYYQKMEYNVTDNWWHDSDYYNIPLDDFMKTLKSAVRKGYTIAIGGDVSEPGYDFHSEVAIVPSFDIPSEYIDENARQLRFNNGSTADDHGIHIVGYMEKNGKDWYLIKDSGAGAQSAKNPGYYFYQEDYVKLKMIDFMVHKDAAKELLSKFAK
ncbi:MAG: C1 family peptidase [Bacteroidota bacterium]|nr:C1 family peptidase [Bacteroidota bacterium]